MRWLQLVKEVSAKRKQSTDFFCICEVTLFLTSETPVSSLQSSKPTLPKLPFVQQSVLPILHFSNLDLSFKQILKRKVTQV